MTKLSTITILGGGLAGAKAAEAAREAGFDGRVVLVGEETHVPYERPPLSKAVLRGEKPPASAAVHAETFYADHDIEVVTGRHVEALDVRGRRVRLAGGTTIAFDAAVIATGAEPRQLEVPGAELAGVHYLRTLDDSLGLGEAIRRARRVAVIGAGWIGTEVAASARQLGVEVVLVDNAPVPLQRVLGYDVGSVFRGLHAEHGVALRLGTGLAELRGGTSVEEVVLTDGRVEAADLVVAGVGVVPRVHLAAEAGLAVDGGVVVDEHLETSAPGVFAAGDVATAWHPFYRRHVRVEHWANALHQGAAAGANAAGERRVYDRLPYFFSDQYDLGMEYVGYGDGRDDVVFRGDVEGREFIAFWLRGGRVTAAMNVNVWDVVDDLRALIAAGGPVDARRLADVSVPLGDLLPASAACS